MSSMFSKLAATPFFETVFGRPVYGLLLTSFITIG